MAHLRFAALLALVTLSSCVLKTTDSQLHGVRVGNSKLIQCKYTHPHLGHKRVEHYALYEARKSGLKPLSLSEDELKKLSNKEKDIAFQKMILESIRHLDPNYFGMLEGMLESFDSGKNVVYEYSNHIGDEEDQEEQISLPKDSFLDDEGQPIVYNPRYDGRICDTSLLIYRKSKTVGSNSFQVAMDRWDPTMDPASLTPPTPDIKALDPELDFLDYRGRAAAKIEDLLDSFELADPNDIITYVAHLVSGTFVDMSFIDYRIWKENHGLSLEYALDKKHHYYGSLNMRTVEFFPDSFKIKSGDLTEKSYSKFDFFGLNTEMLLGGTRYNVDFRHGKAKFDEDQSLNYIWGDIGFSHSFDYQGCSLNFSDNAHGEFYLQDRKIMELRQFHGLELVGCLDSDSLFIQAFSAKFNDEGQLTQFYLGYPGDGLKDINYKYEIEIKNAQGQKVAYKSGDVLFIENGRVVSVQN